MIGSFRNFAKTKFAGLLVFIMIIPFVFWGMGSMFSSGNTNNLAKVNDTNISTQEFIDYLNASRIPQQYVRENLENNIIQELLSGLISQTLLDLEIKDINFIVSEKTLSKKIRLNKNFLDENGNFERIKYEKFLLENNQTAPGFELRLKKRELQKDLFDYMGAGTKSPTFLVKKLFEEENKKIDIEYLSLENFYTKKENISDLDLNNFIKENEKELKIEYLDFDYAVLNPKNLVGLDEFNQAFFDKIDKIEIDISNEVEFKQIVSDLNVNFINVKNFKFSDKKKEIEKKIFELKNNKFDIFELDNNYVLYNINSIEQRSPDIKDNETRNEIVELIYQKNKFEYNSRLLKRINNKELSDNEFFELGKNNINSTRLNSIKDNKKFEINAVELLYSLPINSFTLINDEKNNIYLAKVKKIEDLSVNLDDKKVKDYINKQNSNEKQNILKSYDLLLSNKYDIILNQKTIERVKNFFK